MRLLYILLIVIPIFGFTKQEKEEDIFYLALSSQPIKNSFFEVNIKLLDKHKKNYLPDYVGSVKDKIIGLANAEQKMSLLHDSVPIIGDNTLVFFDMYQNELYRSNINMEAGDLMLIFNATINEYFYTALWECSKKARSEIESADSKNFSTTVRKYCSNIFRYEE